MAYLSEEQVRRLKIIEGNGYGDPVLPDLFEAIAALATSGANPEAANVAELGALDPVGTTDGSAGPGDAALAADVDLRLTTLQEGVDAIIAALVAAGIMAAP